MGNFELIGNVEQAQNFLETIKSGKSLFAFVISYTEVCEIPGITIAGANLDFIKFTPAADAEFLHYGNCKCIDSIPMTPDGKPTPALLTKVYLETASIPHVVINAGSKILPDIPYFETGLHAGKNISKEPGMDRYFVLRAVEYGRILGRTLASVTDCLVIGESIPGGTTTALAVMKGFDIDAKVSSSIPTNPIELKNQIVQSALKRSFSKDPYDVIANLGDPMIPIVAGMVSSASQITKVILAGGTQMAAVLAFGHTTGFNENNTAIGTTSYIVDDKTANFLEVMKKISDIPILVAKPKLENSKIKGLKSFSKGYVKEGAGAGGCMIAAMLKTGRNADELLELTEKEYQRVITSQ